MSESFCPTKFGRSTSSTSCVLQLRVSAMMPNTTAASRNAVKTPLITSVAVDFFFFLPREYSSS